MNQSSRVIILLFSALLILSAYCPAETGKAGKISVDHIFYDFGYVPMDYRMVHTFKVTNIGEGNLSIQKITSNCDCTSANIGDTLLKPGDTTDLNIILHTRDYYGQTNRKINIYSSDLDNPNLELTHSSNIGIFSKQYIIHPKSLFFLPNAGKKEISLFNNTTVEVDYDIELSGDSLFTVNHLSGEIKGNTTQTVQIEPSKDIGKGTFYTSMTVNFKSNQDVRITVPIKIVKY